MTTITINDPRHMDGDPHEVAQTTGEQLDRVLEHAIEAAEEFRWAARGAWMTAEDHITGDMPKSWEFDDTSQGKKIKEVMDELLDLRKRSGILTKAASFNPRAPLGKNDA